jgi:excisionase family DNA binding protein
MLLRTTEAARVIGIKASSIRQLERRGILSCVRDWNGHRRFPDSEVRRFKKELEAGQSSKRADDQKTDD